MPRACCKLHRLLDSDHFTKRLDKNYFTTFCEFLQESCHKRSKTLLTYENPNDREVFVYLFGGCGTRYLTTVLGEFIAFTPQKGLLGELKWYLVIGTRLTSQTKSLAILGKTKLPTALLLIMSYYENYLKQHIHYTLNCHMTVPSQLQCLLFMLQITTDDNLQKIIGRRITSITLCDDDPTINTFTTYEKDKSFHNAEKIITNRFENYLTLHCTPEEPNPEIEEQEKWNKNILTFLMTKNWTIRLTDLQIQTHPNNLSNKSSAEYGETTQPQIQYQMQPQIPQEIMINQPHNHLKRSAPATWPTYNLESHNQIQFQHIYPETISYPTIRPFNSNPHMETSM